MKKVMKQARKIVLIALCIIIFGMIGLIINNRIYYVKYSGLKIDSEMLSSHEIKDVTGVYTYLKDHGHEIFKGFDKNIDLIIFNRKYEFLFTDKKHNGDEWRSLGEDKATGKRIYRRMANAPQAFAAKVGDTWVGSFNTHDYFKVSILQQIPLFMPPQLFAYDDIGYRSIVIHEMAHAYQGKCDYFRVDQAEHMHDICSRYDSNAMFEDYIAQEGRLLEEAMNLKDKSRVREKIREFLNIRDKRRSSCGLSKAEVADEKEFEWLEGCARYAEYVSSRGSKASVSKGLANVSKKVKTKGDERYYVLGMAEILVMKQLNMKGWQSKLLHGGYTPEALLREYIK